MRALHLRSLIAIFKLAVLQWYLLPSDGNCSIYTNALTFILPNPYPCELVHFHVELGAQQSMPFFIVSITDRSFPQYMHGSQTKTKYILMCFVGPYAYCQYIWYACSGAEMQTGAFKIHKIPCSRTIVQNKIWSEHALVYNFDLRLSPSRSQQWFYIGYISLGCIWKHTRYIRIIDTFQVSTSMNSYIVLCLCRLSGSDLKCFYSEPAWQKSFPIWYYVAWRQANKFPIGKGFVMRL